MSRKAILYAVALIGTNPAHSQEAPSLPPVSITGQKENSYSETNVSSATRTDTPLNEIPQSIQVVNRTLIDEQQNITASEALSNASGVVRNAPFSTPAFETTKVRGFAAEQLLDGFTQYYNTGDRESIINTQQIEVLKGANSILYAGGAGTPVGGVINIASKQPERNRFGETGIRFGTNNFIQPFFDINQPLSDQAFLRITGEYTDTESDIETIKQSRYNLNPSIQFTNNSDTAITIQGKLSRWDQQEYQGLPATGTLRGNFRINENLFIGNRNIPDSFSEHQSLRVNLDHKLNERWTLNVQTRISESEFDEKAQSIFNAATFDFTANNASTPGTSIWDLGNVYLTQKQKEKSILGNLTYKFSTKHSNNRLVIGIDYSELKDEGYLAFADTGTDVNLQNPNFTAPYIQPGKSPFTLIQDGLLTNTTYGVYAQLQSDIQERWHTTLGLRQAYVEIDYTELTLASTQKNEANELLPKLGVVYDLTQNWFLFASHSKGLRGQPFTIFAPNTKPVPAESVSSEVGAKFDYSRKLVGQFAAFKIERSNVGVGFPALPNGEQESTGFDTDMTWQIAPDWKLFASYAHVDAEFTRNASATVKAGNKLAGVPRNSGRIWFSHDFRRLGFEGVTAGLGAYWQSKTFVDDANQFQADNFHTIDTGISYSKANYSIGLTIKNITGEKYIQRYEYFGGRVRPAEDTAAYVTLSYRY